MFNLAELHHIVDALNVRVAALGENCVIIDCAKVQFRLLIMCHSTTHLVEDVVVTLVGLLDNNARFLKQVARYATASDALLLVKKYFCPLAESTGVEVANRLCVSKSLDNWRTLEQLLFDFAL